MKQIIVNVSGLSVEEKQRVNEALAKITGFKKMTSNLVMANWMYAPSSYNDAQITYSDGNESTANKVPTHTPQQVLEMAGMAKQGHVHAESMALYADDAKSTDKPWELWQGKTGSLGWLDCKHSPLWVTDSEYRRKPKTKLIHGVEIPDLPLTPFVGCEFYCANIGLPAFYETGYTGSEGCSFTARMVERGLIYPYTEEGKQAAILHAKAMLGIA